MVKLADRKVVSLPPAVGAVIAIPQPAVVSAHDVFGIRRVDPDVVPVAVRSACGVGEAAPAILRNGDRIAHLEQAFGIFGIDLDPAEIEGSPDHALAAVALLPGE